MPAAAVQALASAGHEILWVRRDAPGMTDRDVLAWALREGRVLLTFDKDFGELVRPPISKIGFGVILFRIPMPIVHEAARQIARLIAARNDWEGAFSVVEPQRLRMRSLS